MLTRTFVFWDLVGSTRAWERDPTDAALAVAEMERAARLAIGVQGGELFKLTGDGGCAAFESVTAGIAMQQAFLAHGLSVRVALYSCEVEPRSGPDQAWRTSLVRNLANYRHRILIAGDAPRQPPSVTRHRARPRFIT